MLAQSPPAGPILEMQIASIMEPLLESKARFLGIHGGRGASKSWLFGDLLIAKMVQDQSLSAVCLREVQGSLDQSVKRLLEIRIHDHRVEDYFEITSTQIRSKRGTGVVIFKGLSKLTESGIKSLESFDIAWLEEAQTIPKSSLDTLRPTIRKPGSQIWASWNPIDEEVPIDALLRGKNRITDSVVIEANYWDNPFFTQEMRVEMEHDREHDLEKYNWIWRGEYLKFSEARVFKNWKIQDFDTPKDAILRFGVDWGFFPDPTVMVRGFIEGRTIYIDYEAYQLKCLPRDTPALFLTVPQSETYQILCANDRPERIADIRAAGFNAISVLREPNSVQEGVEFLQDYQIVVHPRCRNTANEMRLFSRKTDPLTKKVLPTFVDANDHCVSAMRCLVDPVRRIERAKRLQQKVEPVRRPITHHYGGGRR